VIADLVRSSRRQADAPKRERRGSRSIIRRNYKANFNAIEDAVARASGFDLDELPESSDRSQAAVPEGGDVGAPPTGIDMPTALRDWLSALATSLGQQLETHRFGDIGIAWPELFRRAHALRHHLETAEREAVALTALVKARLPRGRPRAVIVDDPIMWLAQAWYLLTGNAAPQSREKSAQADTGEFARWVRRALRLVAPSSADVLDDPPGSNRRRKRLWPMPWPGWDGPMRFGRSSDGRQIETRTDRISPQENRLPGHDGRHAGCRPSATGRIPMGTTTSHDTNATPANHRTVEAAAAAMPRKYATIRDWLDMSGMSRTGAYEAIGRGDLRAIKLGTRTLIDVEHGLTWMASLPAAKITPPKSAA
jgi:hypothetical protein